MDRQTRLHLFARHIDLRLELDSRRLDLRQLLLRQLDACDAAAQLVERRLARFAAALRHLDQTGQIETVHTEAPGHLAFAPVELLEGLADLLELGSGLSDTRLR